MARRGKRARVATNGEGQESQQIADRYLPEGGEAAERERLLHPVDGVRGAEMPPLAAGELNAETEKISALGLDREDSTARLNSIRRWLLSDPTFEQDLWAAIRYHANKGSRHAMNAILRLVYGWQEHDNLAEKLGATLDEARSALTTVQQAANLTLDDMVENWMRFAEWLKDKAPHKFEDLKRRINEL